RSYENNRGVGDYSQIGNLFRALSFSFKRAKNNLPVFLGFRTLVQNNRGVGGNTLTSPLRLSFLSRYNVPARFATHRVAPWHALSPPFSASTTLAILSTKPGPFRPRGISIPGSLVSSTRPSSQQTGRSQAAPIRSQERATSSPPTSPANPSSSL